MAQQPQPPGAVPDAALVQVGMAALGRDARGTVWGVVIRVGTQTVTMPIADALRLSQMMNGAAITALAKRESGHQIETPGNVGHEPPAPVEPASPEPPPPPRLAPGTDGTVNE